MARPRCTSPWIQPLSTQTYRRRVGRNDLRAAAGGGGGGRFEKLETSGDERPAHRVRLDVLLIDQERSPRPPIAGFLTQLDRSMRSCCSRSWILLKPEDKRREHVLIRLTTKGWGPWPGTERMPMMLVSWYGCMRIRYGRTAATGRTLARRYQGKVSCHPKPSGSMRCGATARSFPWGDREPTADRMQFCAAHAGCRYRPEGTAPCRCEMP